MSSLTSQQKSIFLTVALVASVLVNVFLFVENNNSQKEILVNKEQLDVVRQQEHQRQQDQVAAGAQVKTMQTAQTELIDITQELRAKLTALNDDYLNIRQTSQLTAEKLTKATQNAKQLQAQLTQRQQQLVDAEATIANLQRALRTKTIGSASTSEFDSFQLAKLSQQLSPTDPNKEIGIVQKSDGSIVISLPVGRLFVPGTVILAPEAALLIAPIAESLSAFQPRAITIIGHSDERIITSALAEKYPTNWELSSVRASKVGLALIEQGIDKQLLMVAGKAATQPVRDESLESAWNINRRVEIVVE